MEQQHSVFCILKLQPALSLFALKWPDQILLKDFIQGTQISCCLNLFEVF